ncbi:hypothetical protein DSECCO2_586270 [anaerobic digester metagenome]
MNDKKIKTMRKTILTLILLPILITSCNVGGMWKDDNIDPKIKEQIHKLNYEIIDGFVNNNPDKVFNICSDKLLEQGKNDLSMLIQQTRQSFSREDFKILNEFYQKNTSTNAQTNVMTGVSGEHDYIIGFKALNSEMFVSVGYFDNDLNQTSLTLIYGKYGNDWKLNIMQVGTLRIMDKDAFDWYQVAQQNYEKGYLIDAVNDLVLANQLLKPANQFWQYQKEKEIQEFGQKVMADINNKFTFPMTVDYVKTKPQIFNIYPQGMNEGYFPMIRYTTSIDLSDTTKLRKECDEIHSKIGDLYNGIDKNKKMIFYRAFKSIPNGNVPVENYGFVQEIKE